MKSLNYCYSNCNCVEVKFKPGSLDSPASKTEALKALFGTGKLNFAEFGDLKSFSKTSSDRASNSAFSVLSSFLRFWTSTNCDFGSSVTIGAFSVVSSFNSSCFSITG